ncbi:MAG: hypothetical protein EPN61_05650 [Burkholderiaceae bacterium]|nr:MAG: hypothetical protein EPN61_05650 [Burkholderiaceae bacterium]
MSKSTERIDKRIARLKERIFIEKTKARKLRAIKRKRDAAALGAILQRQHPELAKLLLASIDSAGRGRSDQ